MRGEQASRNPPPPARRNRNQPRTSWIEQLERESGENGLLAGNPPGGWDLADKREQRQRADDVSQAPIPTRLGGGHVIVPRNEKAGRGDVRAEQSPSRSSGVSAMGHAPWKTVYSVFCRQFRIMKRTLNSIICKSHSIDKPRRLGGPVLPRRPCYVDRQRQSPTATNPMHVPLCTGGEAQHLHKSCISADRQTGVNCQWFPGS